MQTFPLGSFHVGRVGYGAMQLPGPGVLGPPRDHDEAIAVLRRAIELGINHIDTAQFYGPNVVQRAHPRGAAPLPRRPGAGQQGRCAPRRRRELATRTGARRSAGRASRRTCARWAPTGWPRSICASRRRRDPNAAGRCRPRAVRPSAHRDDQGSRRGPHRRHRAEQHLGRPSADRVGPHRDRLRAERLQPRRPDVAAGARRLHRARHRVRAVLPARLGLHRRQSRARPPRRQAGGRRSWGAPRRRSRWRGRCRSRRTCC